MKKEQAGVSRLLFFSVTPSLSRGQQSCHPECSEAESRDLDGAWRTPSGNRKTFHSGQARRFTPAPGSPQPPRAKDCNKFGPSLAANCGDVLQGRMSREVEMFRLRTFGAPLNMTVQLSSRVERSGTEGSRRSDRREPVRTVMANVQRGRDLSTSRLRRFAQGDSYFQTSAGSATGSASPSCQRARRWVPSQQGLLCDWPQRQRTARSRTS